MQNIRELILTDLDGNETVYIIEEFAPNEFRSMPKADWDELQTQKELGGTL